MSFAHLGLMPALLANLQQLGYQQPTAVQQQAIAPVLAGKDVLAAAQTGTGKTAAFTLPVLQLLLTQGEKVTSNCVRTLVLVPTRELAEQVHESIRHYLGELPLRTAVAYGGVRDRKSTRLNSSHVRISYAVFCLIKKIKIMYK